MKRSLLPFLFLVSVAVIFFYQSVFFGKIPFPGDMLIAQYVPWKYESILGFNPGSYPNKAQYFDVIQQLYPWRDLAVKQMMSGRVPLWNPYNFSGSPLLANIQSSVFNPVNIFFFLLPMSISWTITILLQCLLASIFLYLFARKISLPVLPSLLSAVTYSYSLFMTVFLEYNTLGYVVAFFPAALFFFERYREKKTFWRTIHFVVSVSLLFFAGHLQLAVASFVFIIFYAVFVKSAGQINNRRFPFDVIVLMFISVLIASIQLLPSSELVSVSARVSQEYQFMTEKLLIQPWQLIMVAIPDIFGNPTTRNFIPNETYPTKALSVGIVTLLFSLIGIWQWKKEKRTGFFIGALVVILLLVTKNPLSLLVYSLNLPLFSTSSPSNMIFLSSFCLSILAGFGLRVWLETKIPSKLLLYFLGLITILFLLAIGHRSYFQEKNILFSLALILAGSGFFIIGTYKQGWRKILGVCCLVLAIAELFFFFQKFNPFVPKELLYPDTKIAQVLKSLTVNGERVWSFGNAAMESNVQTALGFYSPEGYDPLYPIYYGELLYATREGRFPGSFDRSTRSNAVIAPESSGGISLTQNQARLKVLNLLSVRYILDRVENASSEITFPEDTFKRIYHGEGWSIYENKKAMPNAWLASSVLVRKSSQEFQNTFFNSSFRQQNTVILSDEILHKLTMKTGNVTQFLSLNDRMLYKTKSDGSSVLVLSKTYYPGWEVYVDGRPGKILRTNHALSGVFLPEGEHDVAFYYWPRSFVFGLTLTIIGFMALFLTSFLIQRKKI